jgi:ABC-type polysaccharide/polyol phosphate export permease
MLFFFTPIIYSMLQIPPAYRPLWELNPLLPFIQLFRIPLALGQLPPADSIIVSAVYALVTFVAGSAFFFRSQRSFYSYL